jgi:hypothetical protein
MLRLQHRIEKPDVGVALLVGDGLHTERRRGAGDRAGRRRARHGARLRAGLAGSLTETRQAIGVTVPAFAAVNVPVELSVAAAPWARMTSPNSRTDPATPLVG